MNAEPTLDLLRERFITPEPHFYIRNHGPTPTIDPAAYRFSVNGLVQTPLHLSLEALRHSFPQRTVMATLQCAGNRRNEMMEVAPIPTEIAWEAGAIGNATWTGVPLSAILEAAGVEDTARHVAFMGMEEVLREGKSVGYGSSIPIEKGWNSEVLLAYEMNGEPLTPVHGFPLRLIVPGYIGARSVKWLTTITLQEEPSSNYFQAHAYKLFPPHINKDTVDWNQGTMLGELAVNAVICQPQEGDMLTVGAVQVRGYAVAGDGRTIQRVELSVDEGASWSETTLGEGGEPWAWRFWETTLNLHDGTKTLIVRAWDDTECGQPEDIASLWNFKGYMNNGWHRITLLVRDPLHQQEG